MKRVFFVAPLLCLALLAEPGSPLQYNKEGKLLLPADYREWVFLTSGLGMSYADNPQPNANPLFDNVFVNPAAYQAFLKTGTWPDKTVLVLELRNSDTKVSINKDGRVQTDMRIRKFTSRMPRAEAGHFIIRERGCRGEPDSEDGELLLLP